MHAVLGFEAGSAKARVQLVLEEVRGCMMVLHQQQQQRRRSSGGGEYEAGADVLDRYGLAVIAKVSDAPHSLSPTYTERRFSTSLLLSCLCSSCTPRNSCPALASPKPCYSRPSWPLCTCRFVLACCLRACLLTTLHSCTHKQTEDCSKRAPDSNSRARRDSRHGGAPSASAGVFCCCQRPIRSHPRGEEHRRRMVLFTQIYNRCC